MGRGGNRGLEDSEQSIELLLDAREGWFLGCTGVSVDGHFGGFHGEVLVVDDFGNWNFAKANISLIITDYSGLWMFPCSRYECFSC